MMDWRRAGPLAVLISVLVFSPSGVAQVDSSKDLTQYTHEVWRTEQGLPQDTAQAILQTADGYLWIGTEEGLARFDGVRFTVFDKRNTPAFKSNTISALLEDRDRNLWIGTNGGGLTRFSQGTFTTYTTRNGLSSDAITALCQDREGNLWIGTDGGGLDRFRNGGFQAYTTRDGLLNNSVLSISSEPSGALWIGTPGGLDRLSAGKFTSYNNALPSHAVQSTCRDHEGNLWIGTTAGLIRLREGRALSYTTKQGLSSNTILSLYEDHSGTLWIGTGGGGLDRLRDGKFSSLTSKQGLSADDVLAILEDHEGNIWAGTTGGGLNRLRDTALTPYTSQQGLSNDVVTPIFEDHAGTVWIGTAGGLNRFKGGSFKAYTTRDGLSHNQVFSIFEDSHGNLWVGTRRGLNRFNHGRFKVYTTRDGLPGDVVMVGYADRHGTVWVGTRHGLSRLVNERFVTYTARDGLSADHVLSITQDSHGALWIGTDGGGLSRYENGRFTAYTSHQGLSNNVVWTVYEDSDGALWAGTNGGGLSRFKDGRFTNYSIQDGLFDDTVFRILDDGRGNFWLSSNKGISEVSKRQLDDFAEGKIHSITSKSYGTADGMKVRECNGGFQPAGWKTRDGRLWFPTDKGFVVVDPGKIPANSPPPPVLIEQVMVDGRAFAKQGAAVAPPGRRDLEFHFTAPSFVAPDKLRFRYRLDGFDQEWVDAGSRRQAYYTNIPPGAYTFRVIAAASSDEAWSDTGASVSLRLQPHFYETYYFDAFCVVLLVFLCVGAYQFRVKHLKARQAELMKLVEERTRDLTSAKRELEAYSRSISHEMRTPLNAIIGFTGTLLMRLPGPLTEEQTKQLRTIERSSKHLLSLIDDLLDLAKIEAGKVTLSIEPILLQGVVEDVRNTLRPLAEKKNIGLNVTVPDTQIVFNTDRRSLSQILLNLTGNAIKFTERGEVHITLGRETYNGKTWIQLSVQDTGIGIMPEDQTKLFQVFGQAGTNPQRHQGAGLGLHLSQKLAGLLGGQISFKSEYGKGSTFMLSLPEK